jgi:hypothetical protein
MSVQSSYSQDFAVAVPGMVADSIPCERISALAEGTGISAGLVVLRGTADGQARAIAVADELAADTDAISTANASATTKQTLSGAALDGVVGAAVFWPPRNVTLTFNSHSDWNDTVAIVRGLDAYGAPHEEAFLVPEGGNVTLQGSGGFTKVTSVDVPAATGTNGVLDVGLGVAMGPLTGRNVLGIVEYEPNRVAGAFADKEPFTIVKKGRIYVLAEGTNNAGDPVYVRFVATGGETRGRVAAAPDSTDMALLLGAKFVYAGSGEGLRVVELNLPAAG